jgi:cysteine desulfurase
LQVRKIYLDHNATTPVHPEVLSAMLPYMRDVFGNPSSIHWYGQQARRALDRAREQVARLIGAEPDEIVFESGGTEANNHVLRGVVERTGTSSPHIITSSVEHHALLNPCRNLEARGCRVTYLPVDEFGIVDPESVAEALTGDTVLISIMLANNDVGTLQPVKEIAGLARKEGVWVHTDAVQAVGKIPVDVGELGVDLLTLSAHKVYGPKGVGALYIRRGTDLAPLLHGGHHEKKRRAGTENVPGIVGLGLACEIAGKSLKETGARMAALRDRMQQGIQREIPGVEINGHPHRRLPNTLNLGFAGVDGESLLMNLDLLGIAASTGSACTSGSAEPSHVLVAMGRSPEQASSSIRFSLGMDTNDGDVDAAVDSLIKAVGALRQGERQFQKNA